jgi:hypothetical protein
MMWVMTLPKAEKVGGFFALAKGQKEKEWVVKSLSGQTPFAHLGCSHRSGRDQPVVG